MRHITTSTLTICLLALSLATAPAVAQLAVATANGRVLDGDGKPLQGVSITFYPKSNPQLEYTGTTNKKGRYSIPGLYSPQERDRWLIRVEHAGYALTGARVESRTAQRVLAGDIMELKLKPGQQIPEFGIRPLGTAKVDFTMAPEDEVMAAAANAAAAAGAAGEGGEAAEGGEAPKKDPWGEAVTLAGQNRLEASVPFFEEAVAEEPDSAERHETFAKILYRLERFDESEREALRAGELEPSRADAWMVLSSIYAANDRLDEADEVLGRALSASPDSMRVLERRALIARRRGAQEQARDLYTKITELDASNTAAWLALGDYYAEVGESTKSEQAFQKAVELDPSNAHQIYYNLGALIMNRDARSSGDTQRAVDALRRATEIKPDYGLAHRQLAFALLELGDRSGAASSLEAYVAAEPNSADAAQMKGLAQSLRN